MVKAKLVTLKSGAKRESIYFFICTGCGKKRRSVYKKYADKKICRACRKSGVSENQQHLFDPPEEQNPNRDGKGMS